MSAPLIIVSGSIGAGKQAVAAAIAGELGLAQAAAAENPYLGAYLADPPSWAFHLQMQFLVDGIRSGLNRTGGSVQARSIHEDFHVFCAQQAADGLLSPDEAATLSGLYWAASPLLRAPDLLVHLDCPAEALAARAGGEASLEYLQALEGRYQALLDGWVASPVLRLDAAALDLTSTEAAEELGARVAAAAQTP